MAAKFIHPFFLCFLLLLLNPTADIAQNALAENEFIAMMQLSKVWAPVRLVHDNGFVSHFKNPQDARLALLASGSVVSYQDGIGYKGTWEFDFDTRILTTTLIIDKRTTEVTPYTILELADTELVLKSSKIMNGNAKIYFEAVKATAP